MGVALHKVKAPDVVGPLRAAPNAGAVVEPQPTAWPMLLGHLEPLTAPAALNPVLAHTPACDLQQSGDPAIAIAPILSGKGHDGSGESILVSPDRGDVTLGPRGWLTRRQAWRSERPYLSRMPRTACRGRSGLTRCPPP